MSKKGSHVQQPRRKYPGENQAAELLLYLRSLSQTPKELVKFIEVLKPLMPWLQAKGTPSGSVQEAIDELEDEVVSEVMAERAFKLQDGRFVIEPASARGKAVFAFLRLLREGNLRRVRRCHHCGVLFYARFNHQKFCTEACQENDYHTPEWRKKNRERNRRHQREYRRRNPGRKG